MAVLHKNLLEQVAIDTTQDAIVIDGVSKIFKKPRPLLSRVHKKTLADADTREVRAVDDVSITIKYREIVGILGANGSGKSTLIRMLSTLLIPDTGHLRVFGYDVVKDERMVQRLINRVSVEASFFKKLSPMENLPIWSASIWASTWPLVIAGVVSIPLGIYIFSLAEHYAKRTGRLKRNG